MHHHSMTHDGSLVFLSFMVALFASYTALDMGTRLRRAAGKARLFWLGGSAVVLGGGIWSMHFVAMLAFDGGVPIGYNFGLTALSLVIAIAIVAVGFHIVTRANPSIVRQVAAGAIVGCGVAVMHYTGMAALVLDGAIHYDPMLVAASIVVAIVAATAALWLTLNLTKLWQRVGAAAVMAVAVCGMHYTAMLATSIETLPGEMAAIDPLSRLILAAAVSVGVFLILCLAMVCVFVDRRFELLADREAEGLRAANKALTDSQGAIRNLLDNADQGFLTISSDLSVGDQSSAACEAILGEAPAGKSIIALLCRNTPHDTASAMQATLESVFRDSDDFARELKLELLPTEFGLDGKSIKAGYKFLADSGRVMLILTDVTQTRQLAEAVEREGKRLAMTVLAFTEGEAFAALVNDYQKFLGAELSPLIQRIEIPAAAGELRRHLHTYKGLLAQFSFHCSPRCLNDIETALAAQPSWTAEAAREAIKPQRLTAELELDLAGVTDILGPDFATSGRRIVLSQRQLQAMEKVARAMLASEEGRAVSPPLRLLLQTIAGLGMLDVKAALALHSRGAPALADRLEKQLAPIRVKGADVGLPPERFGEFFRSLVHVFRNAIDHGIERPEQRLLAGKSPDGLIQCDVREENGWVEVLIKDDGAGVDRSVLEAKLIAAGEEKSKVGNLPLVDLVFREGLSSRDTASDISGRGVGLSAVKAELDRVDGSVEVETEQGAGTLFRFRLPVAGTSSTASNVFVTGVAI
ncbi:MAG: MHYT domain-containing protein [Hyphomonadaceae bacterium]|nr:MHYT domain-containing protein [Hyphomonadaceae bacterium]